LNEDAVPDERENVTVGRVLRALREPGVFVTRELAFEPVQQAIDHQSLPVV
jgi:hypothetical protein